MGAPFTDADEMITAPLMVTVRNARGRAMLDAAVAAGRVEVLQRGGKGGRGLPSEGDRRGITMKTVEGDSMVKSLTQRDYVAGDQAAATFCNLAKPPTICRDDPAAISESSSRAPDTSSAPPRVHLTAPDRAPPCRVFPWCKQGAPPFVANILATVIAKTLPKAGCLTHAAPRPAPSP